MRLDFDKVPLVLLGRVWNDNATLYLEVAGPEVAVLALAAYLSRTDRREKTYGSRAEISGNGLALAKSTRYRMLKARLPELAGHVALALIHPSLAVTGDAPGRDFRLLATLTPGDDPRAGADPPPGWFERLNACLGVPLRAEWAGELWRRGLAGLEVQVPVTERRWEQGAWIEVDTGTTKTKMVKPVEPERAQGGLRCWKVWVGEIGLLAWRGIAKELILIENEE